MKEIPLNHGLIALVDDVDFERIDQFTWRCMRDGYAGHNLPRVNGRQELVLMHRLVIGLRKGDGLQIDHRNGNRLDNRRANLRVCTHTENMRNKGKHPLNTSGLKGACYVHRVKKWKAVIYKDKKQIYLGIFPSPELAHEAYVRAAKELHGEFANTGD